MAPTALPSLLFPGLVRRPAGVDPARDRERPLPLVDCCSRPPPSPRPFYPAIPTPRDPTAEATRTHRGATVAGIYINDAAGDLAALTGNWAESPFTEENPAIAVECPTEAPTPLATEVM